MGSLIFGGNIMSSASAGSSSSNSGEKNYAETPDGSEQDYGRLPQFSATSTTCAEAQQGDGPAAASASGSAVGVNVAKTTSVSTCIGTDYAAAACEYGVAVAGPHSAAAASQVGVVAVGPDGAAATSDAANSSNVANVSDTVVVTSEPESSQENQDVEKKRSE